MVPVSSSNISAVGYDSVNRRLVIQFFSGTYEYTNVPESVYTGLISASSKGRYHDQFIKHSYTYRKIG